MNEINRFNCLLDKYLAKSISSDELGELFELLLTENCDEVLGSRIVSDYMSSTALDAADLPPHIAQEIIRNIALSEKRTLESLPRRRRLFNTSWQWIAAASVLVFIALSVWVFTNGGINAVTSLADIIPDSTVHRINYSAKQQLITLADGTSVMLQPGASIHYPQQFSNNIREVYLEGAAFFNVAKNAGKPFYVYYGNVVTKVLGTSFNVSTNTKTGNIEVAVETGKVQVYENEKMIKPEPMTKGLIVTPNQKAIYKTGERVFEATLVDYPVPVATSDVAAVKAAESFVFEHIKLADLFRLLETRYSIEIVVENESIYNCMFSGDVAQQDLYGKLKFICLTTNSDYEINGTRILIKGKGCN